MEKKKFKRTLSCLFGGRGKVQFRRKKLGDKVQAKSSNLPRRFCSNSVGTPLDPLRQDHCQTMVNHDFIMDNHGQLPWSTMVHQW